MQTRISGVILTKDEGKNLIDCINSVRNYLDEIIVIDSSEGNTDGKAAAAQGCINYYIPFEGKEDGFSDLRNFGSQKARNDWVLHVDVDELFSTSFFRDVDLILKDTKHWAYAFSRINLPYYEMYPDYQVRFINKNHTRWIGEVHERVEVLSDSGDIANLDIYPIVHKEKPNKVDVNNRWGAVKKHKNVLICTLFRDSGSFIDSFLKCMTGMIDFSTKQNYVIDLIFIEGNSGDNTYLKLRQWIHTSPYRSRCTFHKIEINKEIDRFERLAIMRNMLLKLGLKSWHDYILMMDSDIIFQEDLLHQMATSLEKNNSSVLAPLVLIDGTNKMYDILAYVKDGVHFGVSPPYTELLRNHDTVEADSVGTCYLIRAGDINLNDVKDFSFMKCYTELQNRVLVKYEGVSNNNVPISEQIGFCQNIRKNKGKITVDKNIVIHHENLKKHGLEWH